MYKQAALFHGLRFSSRLWVSGSEFLSWWTRTINKNTPIHLPSLHWDLPAFHFVSHSILYITKFFLSSQNLVLTLTDFKGCQELVIIVSTGLGLITLHLASALVISNYLLKGSHLNDLCSRCWLQSSLYDCLQCGESSLIYFPSFLPPSISVRVLHASSQRYILQPSTPTGDSWGLVLGGKSPTDTSQLLKLLLALP